MGKNDGRFALKNMHANASTKKYIFVQQETLGMSDN
jgi:hypothetical protein